MSEDWKTIEDFPEYQVSTLGRVKSLKYGKEKIKKPAITTCGYFQVSLRKDGKTYQQRIGRLVALHFLKKVEGKEEVDHINRNKLDNRLENLRWSNRSEQCINRDLSIGKSGHKYIRKQNNKFRVKIVRNKIEYLNWFKTLDEAIVDRDRFLICDNNSLQNN